MNYIEVRIPAGKELIDILVAELAECGFESFEEGDNQLLAYIKEDELDAQGLDEIIQRYNVVPEKRTVVQQNWNAEWEKDFHPVTVEGFCTIRADFHEPDNAVEHDIIITPKMSFGTGHHATTQLMIEQMRDISFEGKQVFDFGTGTGVLAILAARLGAAGVMAIDTDEWSYENTVENIERNGTEGITVKQGSLEVVGKACYDIILANINRHILLQYMADMKNMLNPGGIVVMSGILDEDKGIITQEAKKQGLIPKKEMARDKWICLSFTV